MSCFVITDENVTDRDLKFGKKKQYAIQFALIKSKLPMESKLKVFSVCKKLPDIQKLYDMGKQND